MKETMIQLTPVPTERAILIGLINRESSKALVEEHLEELERLTSTAGAIPSLKSFRIKTGPIPPTFSEKGKPKK